MGDERSCGVGGGGLLAILVVGEGGLRPVGLDQVVEPLHDIVSSGRLVIFPDYVTHAIKC